MRQLYVYKLRSMKDLDTLIDEVSAVFDKKTLLELYHRATAEPYSFLYVKLAAKDRNEMFHQSFTKLFMIQRKDCFSIFLYSFYSVGDYGVIIQKTNRLFAVFSNFTT